MPMTVNELTRVGMWVGRGLKRKKAVEIPAGAAFLSLKQCAVFIGRTEKALYHLVEQGRIPHSKVGKKLQFDRVKVAAWLERHAKRGKMV